MFKSLNGLLFGTWWQIRLVRLQTDNFRLLLRKKWTNDKLPFARWANSKWIRENHLGFRFPFETAAVNSIFRIQIKIIIKINNELSAEGSVDSGVPQGTVLEPCLFNIFINDIDDCAVGTTEIIKFEGIKEIKSEKDRTELQETLNNLVRWADRWGMSFNVGKCKVMHIRPNNPCHNYTMDDQQLQTTDEEKDVGVHVNKNLKPAGNCKKAAIKATVVLNPILRNFRYRDRHMYVGLYKQYVCPHLEFASPAWYPWTHEDIQKIEKVQKKALKLEIQEKRREAQDLAQVFKILKGKDKLNPDILFEKAGRRQNADLWHLVHRQARTDARLHSFSVRIVGNWNSIANKSKDVDNVKSVKKKLTWISDLACARRRPVMRNKMPSPRTGGLHYNSKNTGAQRGGRRPRDCPDIHLRRLHDAHRITRQVHQSKYIYAAVSIYVYGKRGFVFFSSQTINGNRRLLFQQTCPFILIGLQ